MTGTARNRGSGTLVAASAAFFILLTLPPAARGQGMSLDLSDEKPDEKPEAKPDEKPEGKAGFGLDLSGEVDYRPSFALLGLEVVREDGSAPAPAERQRFDRIAKAMMAGAQVTGLFSLVLDPAQAATGLADRAAEVSGCAAKACLDELAHALGVERVANARATVGKGGPNLRVWSYARADAEATETVVLAASSGFDKQVGSVWRDVLQGLSAHLGKLVVRSNFPRAVVMLGDRQLGTGSIEEFVPAGHHTVRVTDSEALPFEAEVVVEPELAVEVNAVLAAKPHEDPEIGLALASLVPANEGPALWKQPGVYVAVAGVAALAAGIGFGASAKALEGRGGDANGDGVRDITRVEMQSAHTRALLANVLVGVGSAAVVGGALWFFVAPVGEPASRSPDPGEPGSAPRVAGWSVSAGGSF